jgi:hypothetical protein
MIDVDLWDHFEFSDEFYLFRSDGKVGFPSQDCLGFLSSTPHQV